MAMRRIESGPKFSDFKAVCLVIAAIIPVANGIINCFLGAYQGRNYAFYLAKAATYATCHQTAGLGLDTLLPATPAYGIFSYFRFGECFSDRVC